MKNFWEAVLIFTVVVFIPACVTMPPLPTTSFKLDQINTSCIQGKVIVLDPGHGGKDPGARGNGLVEKGLTLDVALRLRALLRSKGLRVVLASSGLEIQREKIFGGGNLTVILAKRKD